MICGNKREKAVKSGIPVVKNTARPKDIRERVWDKLSAEERKFMIELNKRFNTTLISGYVQ